MRSRMICNKVYGNRLQYYRDPHTHMINAYIGPYHGSPDIQSHVPPEKQIDHCPSQLLDGSQHGKSAAHKAYQYIRVENVSI